MRKDTTLVYGGPSLTTLLGLIFITLKLCNVITWSWLWVLSPFWISFGLGIITTIIIVIVIVWYKIMIRKSFNKK